MSADRMADCTQKLQATISAAVESWQTRFNSLIVQHVRFLLGPTDVQPVAICLIWCRVVQSRDVSPHNYDGLATSGLAFSVAPTAPFYNTSGRPVQLV